MWPRTPSSGPWLSQDETPGWLAPNWLGSKTQGGGGNRSFMLYDSSLWACFLLWVPHPHCESPVPNTASFVCIPPFPSIPLGCFPQLLHSQEMQLVFIIQARHSWVNLTYIHLIFQVPVECLLDFLPLWISHTLASLILWMGKAEGEPVVSTWAESHLSWLLTPTWVAGNGWVGLV